MLVIVHYTLAFTKQQKKKRKSQYAVYLSATSQKNVPQQNPNV